MIGFPKALALWAYDTPDDVTIACSMIGCADFHLECALEQLVAL